MMAHRDPFSGRRFSRAVILLAVRWCCRLLMFYRGVRDTPTERGITLDAASIHCWVRKCGSKIRNRSLSHYRSRRGLTWHEDEKCIRANGRRFYLWCAVDLYGQLIDFRLKARRDAKAARAVLRQVRETVSLYRALAVISNKAPPDAMAIGEIDPRFEQADAINRHVTGRHVNNGIEGERAALKQILRPMRGHRDMSSAKATLQGIETFCAIRKAEFDEATKGVPNEVAFAENLFKVAA